MSTDTQILNLDEVRHAKRLNKDYFARTPMAHEAVSAARWVTNRGIRARLFQATAPMPRIVMVSMIDVLNDIYANHQDRLAADQVAKNPL